MFEHAPYQQLSPEEKIQLQWMYKIGVPLQFTRNVLSSAWFPLAPPHFNPERFETIDIDVYVRPAPQV